MELNGNKLAFIGCNAKAPELAHASADTPGAAHCDMDSMTSQTRQLVSEGYLVIATFQHEERYSWSPNAQMIRDFSDMAEVGATIVSGSQAHEPHYASFQGNSFLHYGLGNLFFDQYGVSEFTDWAFVDRHVFYAGRYLGTELLTVRYYDNQQPHWATPQEREEMLTTLFATSLMLWTD